MSISALSSNLVNDLSQQQVQNPFQKTREGLSQPANGLQSGDLSGAELAHSNLLQVLPDQQGGSTSSTGSTPANTAQNDVAIPRAQDQYVASTPPQQTLSVTQQVQQDYSQLNSSLQSGDLSAAQSAFASLQQGLQSQGLSTQTTATTPSTTNSRTNTILSDFTALGSALSSGNLSLAQSAFSQLQNDVQTAQQAAGSQGQSLTQGLSGMLKGHHHHHHGGGSSTESASTTSSTDSSSTGSLAATNSSSRISLYA
jgi:hypothetical protein